MDILSRLKDAHKEGNNAKILNLMPELIKAINEGKIVELKFKTGQKYSDLIIIDEEAERELNEFYSTIK